MTLLNDMSMAVDTGRPGMAVRLRHVSGRTVLWLEGEHDFGSADALTDILASAIAADDADIVIDMSETRFVGLATVDLLVRAKALLASRDRNLTLRSPSRTTARVLGICGFASLVEPASA